MNAAQSLAMFFLFGYVLYWVGIFGFWLGGAVYRALKRSAK